MITKNITYFCNECNFKCFGITNKEKHEASTGHTVHKHVEISKDSW